jgi:hypothetical protein
MMINFEQSSGVARGKVFDGVADVFGFVRRRGFPQIYADDAGVY